MKNNISITAVKSSWIEDIARIHFDSLPNDFLPSLGFDFLAKTFYPTVIVSSFGSIFGAVNEDKELIGFVLATTDSSKFLKGIIKKRLLEFLKIGVRSSIRSWENAKKNIQIILSSMFSKRTASMGEIYIIAVKEPYRGKGVGKLLVKESIQFAEENDLNGIRIKTLKTNKEWIDYFVEEGWKIEREFRLIGREYVSLIHRI